MSRARARLSSAVSGSCRCAHLAQHHRLPVHVAERAAQRERVGEPRAGVVEVAVRQVDRADRAHQLRLGVPVAGRGHQLQRLACAWRAPAGARRARGGSCPAPRSRGPRRACRRPAGTARPTGAGSRSPRRSRPGRSAPGRARAAAPPRRAGCRPAGPRRARSGARAASPRSGCGGRSRTPRRSRAPRPARPAPSPRPAVTAPSSAARSVSNQLTGSSTIRRSTPARARRRGAAPGGGRNRLGGNASAARDARSSQVASSRVTASRRSVGRDRVRGLGRVRPQQVVQPVAGLAGDVRRGQPGQVRVDQRVEHVVGESGRSSSGPRTQPGTVCGPRMPSSRSAVTASPGSSRTRQVEARPHAEVAQLQLGQPARLVLQPLAQHPQRPRGPAEQLAGRDPDRQRQVPAGTQDRRGVRRVPGRPAPSRRCR